MQPSTLGWPIKEYLHSANTTSHQARDSGLKADHISSSREALGPRHVRGSLSGDPKDLSPLILIIGMGVPDDWEQIGGPAGEMYAGGKDLYIISPVTRITSALCSLTITEKESRREMLEIS
jgi:hypothetical protein